VFNWWDALRPYLFVPAGVEGATAGRGAGFFVNANAAAAFIVAASVVALPFLPMRVRSLVVLMAFVGIAPTLSRSGLLCAGLVVLLAGATRLLDRKQLLSCAVAFLLLIGAAAIYYDVLLSSSDDGNVQQMIQRLTWFRDLQADESIDDRIYPALRAWEIFLDAPLTGRGVGVTSIPVLGDGTHNMYLMLMAEQGLVGLLLYLSLIAILAYRGWAIWQEASTQPVADIGRALLVYAAFLMLYGFFSHNVLEEPHGIFLMAFLWAVTLRERLPRPRSVTLTSRGIPPSARNWRNPQDVRGRL
jgi:O-antigen ligase